MKRILLIIALLLPITSFGQITFKVENLSKPEKLLNLQSSDEIYRNLILKGENLYRGDVGKDFDYGMIACGETADSLVSYDFQSFFDGMYRAYAGHRPFVISPDMIWLLISQGFAQHVNANSEELRHMFVDFEGQTSLVVETKQELLTQTVDWENLFDGFSKQISDNVGEELVNTLTANFSTTTSTTKIASQITIMEAMKSYFEYVSIYLACGIPEITLLGTTEDWQSIIVKTRALEKYDLGWWTKEMEPILGEFVKTSKGKVNKRFWRNMFRCHSQKNYGAPDLVDGWIVKFFPYDKDGKRKNLENLQVYDNNLPDEIVKVDMKYNIIDDLGNVIDEKNLELWAGFVGLEQNPETFALKPVINWLVKTKNEAMIDSLQLNKIKKCNVDYLLSFNDGIHLRVNEFPEILRSFVLP